jgi:hypothetical protein
VGQINIFKMACKAEDKPATVSISLLHSHMYILRTDWALAIAN